MNTEKETVTAPGNAPEIDEDEPRIYRIIRFRFNGSPRTIRNNVTLSEAQAHCSRKETSGYDQGTGKWFDGYDYMKGCAP